MKIKIVNFDFFYWRKLSFILFYFTFHMLSSVYVTPNILSQIRKTNPDYLGIFTAPGEVLYAFDENQWKTVASGYVELCLNKIQHFSYINIYDMQTFELIHQIIADSKFEKKPK